jgi:hypothetical protein
VLLLRAAQRAAVYLAQPEQEAADVRVAAQVAEVLRGHERAVVFRVDEGAVVDAAVAVGRVIVGRAGSVNHFAP